MKFSEIAPPGREKQVKKLKKKFDDPGAPYAIAWAQHNKHGKPKKKEALGESDDTTYVKMVIQKYPQEWKKFTDTGDLMDAPNIYEKLFVYFHFDTGEMPYGTAKARDGDPYEWIANKLDDLGLVEGKMSEIDLDIKTLSDAEFEKKYGKSKDQMQKDLNEDDVNEADLNAWYAEQYAKELAEKDGKSWDRMSYGDKEDYRKIANKKYGVVKSEGEDVPTQKGRDAKPEVLTKRAMNVVKKQIKKDANKQRRADSKKAIDTDESTNQVAGIGHQGLNFKFKVSDLINHAKQYPVKQVDPNRFKAQLAGRQEDPTKSGQRAVNADLSHPIIVVKFGDGSLMVADGTHRVQKAIAMQQKINARIIPVNDMQKFRVASLSDKQPQKNTQATQQGQKNTDPKTSSAQVTKKLGPKTKVKKPTSSDVDTDGVTSVAQAFRRGYGESTDVEEAPFGGIKKAMNTAKRVAGVVPGLGDVGQQAKGERAMGQVANKIWQSFQQFKASNPNEEQIKGWFQKNYKLDITNAMANGQVDQNKVLQAVKDQYARDKSGASGTQPQPTATASKFQKGDQVTWKSEKDGKQKTATVVDPNQGPGGQQDVMTVQIGNKGTFPVSKDLPQLVGNQTDPNDKVAIAQLQKIHPQADQNTLRAMNTLGGGKQISAQLQKSLQPIVKKLALALKDANKRQRLSMVLGESLSQSDLSKLDMLAREGMVPKNKVARFKTAMRTLSKGKDLPISYKDDVIDVVTKLAKIITKPSVMGMVRKGLKENQTTKTAQEKFKTWVNQANDIIS